MGPTKYTERQRQMLKAAAIEHGWNARELAQAADAGTIADDLEPFEISVSAARDLIVQAKRESRGRQDTHTELKAAVDKLVDAATTEVDLLVERQREGERIGRGLYEAQRALKLAHEWVNAPEPQPDAEETAPEPDGPSELEQRIREEMAKAEQPAPVPSPPTGTHGNTETGSAAQPAERQSDQPKAQQTEQPATEPTTATGVL